MIRSGAAVLVALALSSLASAQPERGAEREGEQEREEAGPAWDRASARVEAARLLKEVEEVLRSSERGDARPAAARLRDPSWALRRFAALRLGTLGLSADQREALVEAAAPGSEPPRADWPPLLAAQALAEARLPDLAPPAKLTRADALKVLVSTYSQEVQAGSHPLPARRALLFELLATRPSLDGDERAWLALALCELCPEASQEVGGAKALEARAGRLGFTWLLENEPYLYWQPARRRFRVDREARAAGQACEVYRRAHPWPAGSGPSER